MKNKSTAGRALFSSPQPLSKEGTDKTLEESEIDKEVQTDSSQNLPPVEDREHHEGLEGLVTEESIKFFLTKKERIRADDYIKRNGALERTLSGLCRLALKQLLNREEPILDRQEQEMERIRQEMEPSRAKR